MQKLTPCKHLLSSCPTMSGHLSLGGQQTGCEWFTRTTKGFNQNSMRSIILTRKTHMNSSPDIPVKGWGTREGAQERLIGKPRVNKARKIEFNSLCKSILHWQNAFVFQGQHSLSDTEQKKPLQMEISFLSLLLKKNSQLKNTLYSKKADSRVKHSATLFYSSIFEMFLKIFREKENSTLQEAAAGGVQFCCQKKVSALWPGGSISKESICQAGDLGSIPWRRKRQPLQSCLGNPMDRGALVGYSPCGCKRTTRLRN